VRIEDIDPPRTVPGAADRILATLEAFGFEWDGEVRRQSLRSQAYEAALERLHAEGLSFSCSCSRASLGESARYPGTCRAGARDPLAPHAIRLRVEDVPVCFEDRVQGARCTRLARTLGDPIIKRRDGCYAYLLAVVVDDADQGVTDVVRGADLIEHTAAQIHLQRALALASPRYAHVPALLEPDGSKLAKSARSVSLDPRRAPAQLARVLGMLGITPPAALAAGPVEALWEWAIEHWRIDAIPAGLTRRVPHD